MSFKNSTLQRECIGLSVSLFVVLWFGHEMLWAGKVPFFRDLGPYFYPMRFSLAESFKAGELPLWDRHVAMGFPLLADFQSGTFYLPNLFYLGLPFFTAVRTSFLFHYLVAATGCYSLCRLWNYPRYLAVIGATLFTLGGTLVSLTNLLNHFQAAVWLPWLLFSWERAIRFGTLKSFLAFTLVALLQFLAGSPEIYAMGMGLVLLDALNVRTVERQVTYSRTVLVFLAANVLVMALAAVQVLPTLELLLESRRHGQVRFVEAVGWSLHPLSLINLFFLDREVDPGSGAGLHFFFLRGVPFFISYYMGAISLSGICLWLYYGSRREKVILLGLIVITVAIALGGFTPLYAFLFRTIPGFQFARFPEKYFFLTYGLLLFITLKGLSMFLERDNASAKTPLLILSSSVAIFALLYLVFRFDEELLIRVMGWAKGSPALSPSTLRNSSAILFNLERQTALSCGILILLFLYNQRKLRPDLFQVLIVGLVITDLFSAHQPYQFLLDPGPLSDKKKIIAAPPREPSRLFYISQLGNLHPSTMTFNEKTFAGGVSSVVTALVPNTGAIHGFDYMQEIDALSREPYDLFLQAANTLPAERLYHLLGALNVKYLISQKPLPRGDITLVRRFPELPSWLYSVNRAIPRVTVVPKAVEIKDPLQVMDRLSRFTFNPRREVILEQRVSLHANKLFNGQAKIIEYKDQSVTIHASLNGSGILVLADSYYPGWRVYVDEKEERILRANFFFRGIPLSAGEHLVEFRYQPSSFILGLIISLVTLGGVVICTLVLCLIRKKGIRDANRLP
ncbi:MAG: YfhO family protein [Candidatus Binatia bacterium]